jgi:hypothetical protein
MKSFRLASRCGYALELKRIFGQQTFVFGYANDVMAYIPTILVFNEGGYEGSRSPLFTSPWAANVETMIIQEVLKLAKRVEVKCLDQLPDGK